MKIKSKKAYLISYALFKKCLFFTERHIKSSSVSKRLQLRVFSVLLPYTITKQKSIAIQYSLCWSLLPPYSIKRSSLSLFDSC